MTASLVLVTWASAVLSLAAGETCSKVSACSAEISRYPQLEEVGLQVAGSPISPQEASGWGSGMLPLYDELLDEQNPLDYTATPDVSTFSLCDCANNQTCDSSIESRNMNLDNSLRLTFCNDVDVQIQAICKGKRGVVRVIGPADETGNFISKVDSTIIFCNCPTGYQKKQVEVWDAGKLQLQYTCV